MIDVDVVVVGAGVVGLAVARELAARGRQVLVLEQEGWPGQHASSRNSEVIHAGIYYAPGSLKARLCREGRELLYAWCAERGVPHRRIGKLLVAVADDQRPALQRLQANAAANGIELQPLNAAEVLAREPQLRAVAGLWSPLTGIVDSHALLQSYEADLQAHGGQLHCHTRVERIVPQAGGWQLQGDSAGQPFVLGCRWLVNCAGLFATRLAASLPALQACTPSLHPCQGRYFSHAGAHPFRHLVYPMPETNTAGLGVHATLDLAGQLRFGPDVRYCEDVDYQVDERLRDDFAAAIRRYWPDLDAARLQPAYAGMRAKLSGPGEPAADFQVQSRSSHGLPGLINLYGIESPGLTASLALAREVAERLAAE